MPDLTLVIPTFNEAAHIRANVAALRAQLAADGVDAAIVLVDDGSPGEGNWAALQSLAEGSDRISAVRLSRNFGKEAAVFAGLAHVRTPLCLVMDSDLQHPPRCIRPMLDRMRETGADLVEGVKASRGGESAAYKLQALFFYRAFKAICGLDLRGSSDFKLFNRKVLDALLEFRERSVFFRGLVGWSGFRRVEFPFDVDDRADGGGSRFSAFRLARFAVHSMLVHSGKPLYLVFAFSLAFAALAAVLSGMAVYQYFAGTALVGFPTTVLVLSIFGSATLFSLGIIGLYLSRIYEEVKQRPRYIVSERVNLDDPA